MTIHPDGVTDDLNRPVSITRLLLLIAALTNPFCWLPCIDVARAAFADGKTGDLRGVVYVVDSPGTRSVVTGANVGLTGSSLSLETVTGERGSYSFKTVAPGTYRIEVKAPGLIGSSAVTILSGAALDVPVQLKVETVKQSMTATGSEPALLTQPSGQTVINRSVVLDALWVMRP